MEHGGRNSQFGSRLPDGEPGDALEVTITHPARTPTESLTPRPDPCESSSHALGDPRPLKLGDGGEDVHLEFPGWRSGIDTFREADECNAERLKILQQGDQVTQVPTKPIQPPNYQYIESALARIRHQSIQPRPAIFGTGNASVYEFRAGPAAGCDVPVQFKELVFAVLVGRADARAHRAGLVAFGHIQLRKDRWAHQRTSFLAKEWPNVR